MCDHLISVLRSVTVEPVTVLFYLATSFQMPTDDALWYRKVCLQLYNDKELCANINANASYAEMEKEVQSVNSQWNFFRHASFAVTAMVTSFLYGSWSDRISRKLPILLPLFGLVLGCSINITSAIFITSSLYFLLMSSALHGILGGMLTMLMSTMSYISDVSTPESRTLRLSILYASANTGSFIAYTLSGVIFDLTGFVGMYSICLGLSGMSIVYAVCFIKDIKPQGSENHRLQNEDSLEEKETVKPTDGETKSNCCKRYCDVKHAKEAFLVTFQHRDNNHRVHIVTVLVVLIFYSIGSCTTVQYLYLKHPPLGFSQTMYGFFEGWSMFMRLTVNVFFVPMLKKCHLPDIPLLILALISHVMSVVLMAFSKYTWMVFLVPVVAYMSYGIFTFLRSFISSMVRTDELGKIFAVFAVLENLGNILAIALFSYFLYPQTIDIFAGFTYLFQGFIMLIPIGIAGWLFIDLRHRTPYAELNEGDEVRSENTADIPAPVLTEET